MCQQRSKGQYERGGQTGGQRRVVASGDAHERTKTEELRQHEVVDEQRSDQQQRKFGHARP